MSRTFDTTAWTRRIPRRDYRAFVRNAKHNHEKSAQGKGLIFAWSLVAFGWIVLIVAAGLVSSLISGVVQASSVSVIGAVFSSVPLVILGVSYLIFLALVAPGTYWAIRITATRWSSYYRSARLARENGMSYSSFGAVQRDRNTVFGLGFDTSLDKYVRDPRIPDSYSALTNPGFEIGDYIYTTVVDDSEAQAPWGYVRVQLPKSYPHIVFQERSSPAVTWPQTGWQDLPQHTITIPGYDGEATLFCPDEFAADARAIFGPELILTFKQRPKVGKGHLEGEILGDQLWIYHYTAPFEMNTIKKIRPAFEILATVLRIRDAATGAQRPGGPRAREA